MENIFTQIVTKADFSLLLQQLLKSKYLLPPHTVLQTVYVVEAYFRHLSDDVTIVTEYPYVDKMYRNTYYHYYSSKLEQYSRHCIRLSFFKQAVKQEDFRKSGRVAFLQKHYGGFLILRPTFPNVLGRSHLSSLITRHPNIITSHATLSSTVCGVKLFATGFPHASQDQEMMTCAETTIWSLMEYFGNRYADYRPSQPNEISKVLNNISFERLLPSKGLTVSQISFAVKEFGFGVRSYTANQHGAAFESILRAYVESGIPVVAALQNNQGIGHAVNVIGREPFTSGDIENLQETAKLSNGTPVLDFATMPVRYVMIDDNYPPYQLAHLANPASYYTDPRWAGCTIGSFIVPLYSKIYLEAAEAREAALLALNYLTFLHKEPIVVRTFLASSRSYKHYLALNESLDATAKELLLSLAMPKFVWITEITTKALLEQHLCNGLVITDATEPKRTGVIACLAENSFLTFSRFNIQQANLSLPAFEMFDNLKTHVYA